MYTIRGDAKTRLLRLTLWGFWSIEDATAFVRDQQAEVMRMGPPFGSHLTLIDARAFELQSRQVADALRALVTGARSRSARMALVGGEGIKLLQFRRVTTREDMRWFDDVAAAEAWLLSGTDPSG